MQCCTMILRPDNRRKFRVYFYCRFRDDILLLAFGHVATNRELLECMRYHAKPFVLKLESGSKQGCQMLDLNVGVSKGLTFDSVFFRLYVKETSIWKPVSQGSIHPINIHTHWPRAQMQPILARFTSEEEGKQAVQRFKQTYFDSFRIPVSKSNLPKRPKQNTSWIVLPYNLCLVPGLTRLVSTFVVPLGFFCCKIGLSWKLSGKHLIHLLRRRGDV